MPIPSLTSSVSGGHSQALHIHLPPERSVRSETPATSRVTGLHAASGPHEEAIAPLAQRIVRPAPSAGLGAIKQTLLFLATLLGTASGARPNRVVPVHVNGTGRALANPTGLLDDLIPVLKDAGVELFYVARPSLTESQYGAEVLSAALQGCVSAANCSLTLLVPIPAQETSLPEAFRSDRRPGFLSSMMTGLFGENAYQLGSTPSVRFTALLMNPDLQVHAASTFPRSPLSPRPFPQGEAPGVMSAPFEMIFEVVTGRNRIYSPFSQRESPPVGPDYEVPADPQLEQAQRDRYRLFRDSRLPAAAIVTSDWVNREYIEHFSAHFRRRGFAVTHVPLHAEVTAIVVSPGSTIDDLRKFASDFGPRVIVEEPLSRLSNAPDNEDLFSPEEIRWAMSAMGITAILGALAGRLRLCKRVKQGPAPLADEPGAPVVHVAPRRGGAKRPARDQRALRAVENVPRIAHPTVTPSAPLHRGHGLDTDKSPKQAALDTATALGNATGEALTAVLKSIAREIQSAAMDPQGVALAAGMLHGVIDHARGNPYILNRYFDALGMDFPTVRQLVADARLQQDTWQLEAAQKLLLSDVQAVRLAVNARGGVPDDDLTPHGWALAHRRAPPVLPATRVRLRIEAQAGRSEVIRLNRSAVTDEARRIARAAAGDGRTAGIVIGTDIFIPGPQVLPHLHINDKMVTLTLGHGSDGGHKDLVSGDALQLANLEEGIRLLEADPLPGGAAMLEMLHFLRED